MKDRLVNVASLTPLPTSSADWEIKTPYTFAGLGIVIEHLAGDTRSKTSDSGLTIAGVMPSAYGFILRTTDAHGDEIDMYLSSMPKEEDAIYVIDQIDPATGLFDEHKVMFGFGSIEEAVHLYTSVFSDGTGAARLGAITEFNVASFCEWLMTDGTNLRAASTYKADGVKSVMVSGIKQTSKPSNNSAPRDNGGGILIDLPSIANGPKMTTSTSKPGCFDYTVYLFSALDMRKWSNIVDTFCRVLDLATENDTMSIYIASPGGSVHLMGRMISAISRTKAKVSTYAQGGVASAATAIWVSGHTRYILPGAYFMQHMSSQLLIGKTTDIAARSVFGVAYIERQMKTLIDSGLFTTDEVNDMIEKSADVFISGREAIARVGAVSSYAK